MGNDEEVARMKESIFNVDRSRNELLAQAYRQISIQKNRRNIPCLEVYRSDSYSGNYVCHNHNWGWSEGLGALSKNVIRYVDRAGSQVVIGSGCQAITTGEVNVSVWRPDNKLSMVQLTSCALADVMAGNVVVMSDDIDASKLERIAKCLKAGVHCLIMDMAIEKIERILRAIKLDVVLFLDENMRVDSIKCQGIVKRCHHQLFDSEQGFDRADKATLEDLFAGISLQDLADKSAESVARAGGKRVYDWSGSELHKTTRPRIGL